MGMGGSPITPYQQPPPEKYSSGPASVHANRKHSSEDEKPPHADDLEINDNPDEVGPFIFDHFRVAVTLTRKR